MEIDWDGDFWADHDEDCHGRIEDQKEEYPEDLSGRAAARVEKNLDAPLVIISRHRGLSQ